MRRPRLEYKYWTKDCNGCRYRDENICLWGVRDKELLQRDGRPSRRCEYLNRPPHRYEIARRESAWHRGKLPPDRYRLDDQLPLNM